MQPPPLHGHARTLSECPTFRHPLVASGASIRRWLQDLGKLGRDLKHTIIIDNSPTSYLLHQSNALPILSWFDDEKDRELYNLLPLLEECYHCDNVTNPLLKYQSELGDAHMMDDQ
jgi:hypothetical protein